MYDKIIYLNKYLTLLFVLNNLAVLKADKSVETYTHA